MSALTDTIKQMLNALACADAAEYLTPGQKTEYLNKSKGITDSPSQLAAATATPLAKPLTNNRRVALYMGSELPSEMMDYVLQTCGRLKHDLTVLTFQSETIGHALLKPYLETLTAAGIDLQLVSLIGDPIPGLTRYLRNHPEVAFLACKDTGYLGRSFLSGTERLNALPVPVVLLETQRPGVRKQPAQADQAKGKTSAA